MIYKLIIKDLKIMATHGILELEKISPQEFLVNMVLETEFNFSASEKDELPPSKCYGLIREYIIKYFTENKHNTLEKISLNICEYILSLNTEHKKISLSIIKTKLLNDCNVGIELTLC